MDVVFCDDCKGKFIIDIKSVKLEEGTERIYFICPHCNKEYTSYYTNVLVKIKQKRMQDIIKKQRESRGKKDIKQSNKLYKQYQKLKKEIKRDMDNLKKRIEGD